MQIKHHKLKNGITLLVDTVDSVESVSIQILIKTGSINEESYSSGISHCIEHMNFKGTSTRSAKQIAEEFDMIGGYLNAYTGKEQTVYYAKVLKENFPKAIEILSDLLYNSSYQNEELIREKKVILEEIAEIYDDPSDLVYELFQSKQYENQQAGKPIIGTCESVNNITREEIIKYITNRYLTNNIIIGISGKVEYKDVEMLIEDYFQLRQPHNFSTLNSKDDAIPQNVKHIGGSILLEKDIQQTHIVIGFPGISFHHPDYYTYQVASLIAGGSMASRLFQEVREKRGLVYSISTSAQSYSTFGSWEIYTSSKHEKINEVIDAVSDEMHKMSYKIHAQELDRAKAQLKSNILMALESTTNRAGKLVADYAVYGVVLPIVEITKKIEKMKTSDIEYAIKNILQSAENQKPTFAAIGKLSTFYKYDEIINKLLYNY